MPSRPSVRFANFSRTETLTNQAPFFIQYFLIKKRVHVSNIPASTFGFFLVFYPKGGRVGRKKILAKLRMTSNRIGGKGRLSLTI